MTYGLHCIKNLLTSNVWKTALDWKKDLHQADDSGALAASNSFPVIWEDGEVLSSFVLDCKKSTSNVPRRCLKKTLQKTAPRHQPSFRVASNSKAMQRRNEIASRAKTYCAIALPHDEWSRSDPADPGDRVDWDSLRWLWSLMVPRVTHVRDPISDGWIMTGWFLKVRVWISEFCGAPEAFSSKAQSQGPRSIWNAVRLFETWSCSPSTHEMCPHLAMMISWHHMAFRAESDNRHMWGMKCIKHMKCAIPLEIFSWIPYTFNLMVRRLWTQRTATVFPNVSFGTVLGRLDLDILTILCAIAAICKFRRPCLAQSYVCPFEAWKAWNWKEIPSWPTLNIGWCFWT